MAVVLDGTSPRIENPVRRISLVGTARIAGWSKPAGVKPMTDDLPGLFCNCPGDEE